MSEIDDQSIRDKAREIILSHTEDIEYMSIGEMMDGDPVFEDLTEDEFDAEQDRIQAAISEAQVAVTWPDEQSVAEPDEELGSALARINATLERHAARGTHGGEYLDDDIRSILKGRMLWKGAASAEAATS